MHMDELRLGAYILSLAFFLVLTKPRVPSFSVMMDFHCSWTKWNARVEFPTPKLSVSKCHIFFSWIYRRWVPSRRMPWCSNNMKRQIHSIPQFKQHDIRASSHWNKPNKQRISVHIDCPKLKDPIRGDLRALEDRKLSWVPRL